MTPLSHVLCHCRPQVCIITDSTALGEKAHAAGLMVIKLKVGWPTCCNVPVCLAGSSRVADLHGVRASHYQHTDCLLALDTRVTPCCSRRWCAALRATTRPAPRSWRVRSGAYSARPECRHHGHQTLQRLPARSLPSLEGCPHSRCVRWQRTHMGQQSRCRATTGSATRKATGTRAMSRPMASLRRSKVATGCPHQLDCNASSRHGAPP